MSCYEIQQISWISKYVWRETKTLMPHNVSFIVCLEDNQHKTWYNNPQILESKEILDWIYGFFVHFAC